MNQPNTTVRSVNPRAVAVARILIEEGPLWRGVARAIPSAIAAASLGSAPAALRSSAVLCTSTVTMGISYPIESRTVEVSHPLAGRERVSPAEAAHHGVILPARRTFSREFGESAAGNNGVEVNPRIEVGGWSEVKRYVGVVTRECCVAPHRLQSVRRGAHRSRGTRSHRSRRRGHRDGACRLSSFEEIPALHGGDESSFLQCPHRAGTCAPSRPSRENDRDVLPLRYVQADPAHDRRP